VYIESQFDRCLDQLFGIVLSPADDAKLIEKYGSADPKRKGMVSYRRFCEVIGAGMFQQMCSVLILNYLYNILWL